MVRNAFTSAGDIDIVLPSAVGAFFAGDESAMAPAASVLESFASQENLQAHLHIDHLALQWIVCIAAAFLLFVDRTEWRSNILTSLLVPFLFLNLPWNVMNFARGDIGHWIAFIVVVLRLFFNEHVPIELELPVALLLLVVTAPHDVIALRGSYAALIISLVIGLYLGYQHLSASGSGTGAGYGGAFSDGRRLPVTLAILALVIIPSIMFIQTLH